MRSALGGKKPPFWYLFAPRPLISWLFSIRLFIVVFPVQLYTFRSEMGRKRLDKTGELVYFVHVFVDEGNTEELIFLLNYSLSENASFPK